jgi:hypothetical protein
VEEEQLEEEEMEELEEQLHVEEDDSQIDL